MQKKKLIKGTNERIMFEVSNRSTDGCKIQKEAPVFGIWNRTKRQVGGTNIGTVCLVLDIGIWTDGRTYVF